MKDGKSRPIGIDLGTTFTVVATVEDGRPSVLPNSEGENLTPSVVSFFHNGKVLVGRAAKHQAVANPEGTVSSIKRRMGSGRMVKTPDAQFSPEEVSSLILGKVKADAEEYLGEAISRAVITVPAYFNDRQRQATKQAALLAGLDVTRMINEPTAAALAYGLDKEDANTILVWDLGGGTFDVSILEVGEGVFEVRAVCGDTLLGGDDFDKWVMERLATRYTEISGFDFPADAASRQWLLEAAERAKKELSYVESTPITLQGVRGDRDSLDVELSRAELELGTADLLHRMAGVTRRALADARLVPADIERVILVGGATRMPAVRRLARELLGKEPYRYINPDEVVAMGAAVEAGMLAGLLDKIVLLDVLPLSLGVETQGGLMAQIIRRNSPLPADGSRVFTTAADHQGSMDIHVLQGERPLACDNVSLGMVELSGIAAAPRGAPKVEVAFDVDMDGIVHVRASDLSNDNEVTARMTSTKLLDPLEIRDMAAEALACEAADGEKRSRVQAGIEAKNLVDAARAVIDNPDEVIGYACPPDITEAMATVENAVVRGTVADILSCSRELKRLLASSRLCYSRK